MRFAPVELAESQQLRLQRLYPRTLVKPAVRTILVPRPTTAPIGGKPLRDTEVLTWAAGLLRGVLVDGPARALAHAGQAGGRQ